MQSSKKINIAYIKTHKLIWLFASLVTFGLGGLSLTIFLFLTYLKSIATLVIFLGLIFFVIIPLIIISRLKKIFADHGFIELTNKFLKIGHNDINARDDSNDLIFHYDNIKDYKLGKSDDGNSSLCKLTLRDGTKISYSFFKEPESNEEIIQAIQDFIFRYNKANEQESNKIIFKPNFFASRRGQISVKLVGILMIIGIGTLIFYKPITIPFSFVTGALLYLGIKSQQKSDLAIYEKFKQ